MEPSALLAETARVVLPAALVAGVLLALAWRAWERTSVQPTASGAPPGQRAVALVLALALAATYYATHGAPRAGWHPDLKVRVVYVALLLGCVAPWTVARPGRAGRRWRNALAAAACAYLLGFKVQLKVWSPFTGGLWVGFGALVWSVVARLRDAAERRRPGPELLLALLLPGSLAAGALAKSGSATLAMLLGGVLSAVGAACVLGLWRRDARLGTAGSFVFTGATLALYGAGVVASQLPPLAGALLALALALPLVTALPACDARRTWQRVGLGTLLGALPAGAALWLAWDAIPPNPYAAF